MRLPILLLLSVLAAAGAGAAEPRVVIGAADCGRIVAHRPGADVAYQAGRDAEGGAVAPADLPGSGAVDVPNEVTIDLVIPLAVLLGADRPPLTETAELNAGRIVVDRKTGRLSYNGRPLGDPAANAIAEECARQLRARE